jgi:hypothetical protein
MTSRIEERSYKWPRRYVFTATLVLIVVLLALPFLL